MLDSEESLDINSLSLASIQAHTKAGSVQKGLVSIILLLMHCSGRMAVNIWAYRCFGLQLPESLTIGYASSSFWELKFKNVWKTKY